MEFSLPKLGQPAIVFSHFPTHWQAFLFRAWEYIPRRKIAQLLDTTEETVYEAAMDMGLPDRCPEDLWLKKGYITIIRQMWHILPYDQLLQLLEMDADTLAVTLREDDFLDIKLRDKPLCQPVKWQPLTIQQQTQTAKIRKEMEQISFAGRAPFDFRYEIPKLEFSGKPIFETRMIYAFSGLYQYAFDVDSREYCPDEMLEAYSKLGVNAVWTQGILFQLCEFPFAPEISKGWQQRLNRAKEFADRLEKYGMKLFLYLNEPRSMEEKFYTRYPHLRGHDAKDGKICLCTSTPEVRKYLTDGVESICRAIPNIGGFFTISRSENPTNCYSHSNDKPGGKPCTCPRCSQRPMAEVIAENIACYREGADRVSKNIKVIAWDWQWEEETANIINALPEGVTFQAKSEDGVVFTRGGIENSVSDYAMSVNGPGAHARKSWAAAKARGLDTSAKVQVNTTWEGSTIPALPVYPLVEEHMEKLAREGVSNIMLSWTLGGYPSRNIAHAAKHFYEGCKMEEESDAVKKATALFAQAFQEFPFDKDAVYAGPCNAGPSNLLYLQPTGYRATMTCFSYDSLVQWRAKYPEDVFENQYAKLCDKWAEGLKLLENEPLNETVIMGRAAYCLYSSCLNQIRFYRARAKDDREAMLRCAQAEKETAKEMLKLMNLEPAIGYEAANHYYFSRGQIAEKIINCANVIEELR